MIDGVLDAPVTKKPKSRPEGCDRCSALGMCLLFIRFFFYRLDFVGLGQVPEKRRGQRFDGKGVCM